MIKLSSIKVKDSTLIDLTCLLWLINSPLKRFFAQLLGIIGLTKYNQIVVGVITFIPLIVYIIKFKKIPWKYFHWLFALCSLFFIITYFMNPGIMYWYSRDIFGISYTVFRPDHGAIWGFLIIELLKSDERIWRVLKTYCFILFLYNMFLLYVRLRIGYWLVFDYQGYFVERDYSLAFGYDMAFVVIFLMASYFYNKKIYKILLTVPCLILIFIHGSRGAFLCIIVAMILLIFSNTKTFKSRVKNIFFVAISLGGIYYLFKSNIIYVILDKLKMRGFYSRTLDKILLGETLDDSGRNMIYSLVREKIKENPWGYGAYGDRPILGPYFYWGYSHSILYEMAINFGILITVLILSILLVNIYKILFNEHKLKSRLICIILFSMTTKLLISDTFWGYNYFWMLLSYIFFARIKKGECKY